MTDSVLKQAFNEGFKFGQQAGPLPKPIAYWEASKTAEFDGKFLDRAKQTVAEMLGYKNWEDATDYRLSGEEDRKRDETLKLFVEFFKTEIK